VFAYGGGGGDTGELDGKDDDQGGNDQVEQTIGKHVDLLLNWFELAPIVQALLALDMTFPAMKLP
jgi:hypothetical protein